MVQKQKHCVNCGKPISVVSTRCRKCAKQLFSEETKNSVLDKQVVELYTAGERPTFIADKFGRSTGWVNLVLKRHGVKRDHGTRRYSLDESFFDRESAFKYYVLGLLATDGYVSHTRKTPYFGVSLHKKDIVLLNDLRRALGTNKPLYADKEMLSLVVYSSRLVTRLVQFGIVPQKTHALHIQEKIPREYLINFLHGCFDGDGSITAELTRSADICLCKTASKSFADQLVAWNAKIGFKVYSYHFQEKGKVGQYQIKKSGRGGLAILREFYRQRGLFLPRKYEVYLRHVRLTPDELMLEQAHNVALRSTCNRMRVGVVITNAAKTQVVSIGYNGQARGLANHCRSIFPGECGCVHAEINALIKASGDVLYCTHLPCPHCAVAIINSGIQEVQYLLGYRKSDSIDLFKAAGVRLIARQRRSYAWKLNWHKEM